ncbi:uncharacterized protein DNG_00023 [Cephalotrichum gorgonifer]|uniref:Uncharacterized protein n=1 Tax=Cephalotrichum gorgonifer TaxID=2041049 RepID=A0AAE8MPL0_9PEZI|nr:uncharacterized protein DNG_00023 [Cephalotrichum gorgonifer]
MSHSSPGVSPLLPPGSSTEGGSQPFKVGHAKFRVAAPAPLGSFLIWIVIDKRFQELCRFEHEFCSRVEEILSKNNLEPKDVDFAPRHPFEEGSAAQPTLLIVAPWAADSPITWERIVCKVKEFVDRRLHGANLGDKFCVCVEMANPLVLNGKVLGPVLDNPQLESDWPGIQGNIFSMLKSRMSTKGRMNALSLFRLGYWSDPSNNPITVFISMDPDSPDEAWPQVLRDIQLYLDGLPHDLTAHMEHNTVQSLAFQLLGPDVAEPPTRPLPGASRVYQKLVNLGDDFGPSLYLKRDDGKLSNPGFGTLGCYVEVKRTSPDWRRYGLTSYHTIRPCFEGFSVKAVRQPNGLWKSVPEDPADNTTLREVDLRGRFPNSPVSCHSVESPSRWAHNYSVYELKHTLRDLQEAGGDNQEYSDLKHHMGTELEGKIAFFDGEKHVLGAIWAASGLGQRTKDNQRLDWALLDVIQDRQGGNKLPTYASWIEKYAHNHRPLPGGNGVPLKPAPSQPISKLHGGELAFKLGARSGQTLGSYSRYRTDSKVKYDEYMGAQMSSQYVFVPHGGKDDGSSSTPFADEGDSGAVVYNASGEGLGLLFTGQVPKEAGGQGYFLVTPMEDVFKDIKSLSRGEITDIRLSPW